MIRRDQAYWARLRKDARSALAVGCALLASLMALLCILGLLFVGPPSQTRGNPLYWLCLLPFAWWASGLTSYEPRPVRMLRPALALAVVASLASVGVAAALGRDLVLWIVGTTITVVSAVATEFFYRGSLLYREGPAR